MARKTLLAWAAILLILIVSYSFCSNNTFTGQNLSRNDLEYQLGKGNIESIFVYDNGDINGTFHDHVYGKKVFKSHVHPELVKELESKIASSPRKLLYENRPSTPSLLSVLFSWGPMLLILFFWIYMMRRISGSGSSGALSFGKSKAKLARSEDRNRITFKNVAGVEEAMAELQETVEFLKEPKKFTKLGGRLPKGVLLMGSPGTGKTLLAKAVAGEANVPFFSITGADFIEMFVGVGASRVRDLFEQGKKNAPCIIFIDEIDAVGGRRAFGFSGAHEEREQTLNQMLSEMDGFESNEGVIIVAATNRPDILDPALLRPGRFDRRVVVDRPDVRGREAILKVHVKKIPLADNVDLGIIARGTSGFVGADLANLVNEAALNAARNDQKTVEMQDFEFSKDKVTMGSERRSMFISDKEKTTTAIHEAGHALVALFMSNADPLHKVTIIPRGMALGLTQQLPEEDRHNYSKEYLTDQLAILMGGRCAEEIILNQQTTGASNDIERATEFARRMVCEWGMSELGPQNFISKEGGPFLGRSLTEKSRDYSELTAQKIDEEVKKIIKQAHETAGKIIKEKMEALKKLVDALLVSEILDGEQIKKIVGI